LPFLLEVQQESQRNPQYLNSDFEPPHLSFNLVLRNEPYAKNITPAIAEATVMLRPMPGVDHQPLLDEIQRQATAMGLEFDPGFLTPPLSCDRTVDIVQSLLGLTGQANSTTVSYGTDGCILGVLKNLCVCGPGSIEQAHRHDEWISLTQLDLGTDLYHKAFRHWCCR
jgi:acetylornithine deacetylase